MTEIITIILTIGVGYVMGHIEEIYFWLHEPEQPEDTEFDINPKEMDDKNIGCKFCKYKDICYMTSSDIVKLKKIDNVFSEVNDNAKMD